MKTYSYQERRWFPRTSCSLKARCSPLGLIGNYYDLKIVNISLGGGLLKTKKSFKKSECLLLTIYMPCTLSITTIVGKVLWQECIPNSIAHNIGVEFLQLDFMVNQFVKHKRNKRIISLFYEPRSKSFLNPTS
jgi:PilZ domain